MADARRTEDSGDARMREYVESLFDEMEQKLALQRSVVLRCMDGMSAARGAAGGAVRERELRVALMEAIEVLEDTKRAFKSKRLGDLREKLVRVLAATAT